MKNFFPAIIGIFFIVLPPVVQWLHTGVVLYKNAFDEESYLQYEFAQDTLKWSRASQALVVFMHALGFSGAETNFFFDLVFPFMFFVILTKVFKRLSFSLSDSSFFAFLVVFLPIVFNSCNPEMSRFFSFLLQSGWCYWITAPEAVFLPIVRTPEPQVSLVLIVLGVYCALRFRKKACYFLFLPFVYPFIAVPVLFVILSEIFYGYYSKTKTILKSIFLSVLTTSIIISLCLFGYLNLFLKNASSDIFRLLVPSRSPFVSTSGILSLSLWALLWKTTPPGYRALGFFIAVAPFFAVNTQVITGWFAQPNNYEQYAGVFSPVLILIFGIRWNMIFRKVTIIGLLVALFIQQVFVVKENQEKLEMVLNTPGLMENLEKHSAQVAMNDMYLSSFCNLLYPRQPATPFSYVGTYPEAHRDFFKRYLCAKQAVLERKELMSRYQKVLSRLDHDYRYRNEDFILSHLNRKKTFKINPEGTQSIEDCPKFYWFYIFPKEP